MSQQFRGEIIDGHTHLWSLADDKYPWLRKGESFGPPGRLDRLKGKDYSLDDYRRDIEGTGVVGSVHVEALWDPADGRINETKWLETLDGGNLASRYVAGLDFGLPTTADEIAQQAAFARVRGVRQVIAWTPHPDRRMADRPHITAEPTWREAIPVLLEHDLHLELLLYPNQGDDVAELARDFPSLSIVVNHMASPIEQDEAGLKLWREAIVSMSSQPNVYMKASAAAAYLSEKTAAAMRPFLEHVVDNFGADRVIYGSDFPVGTLTGLSYSEYLEAYTTALSDRGTAEQQAIFHDTAAKLYRMDV